MMQFSRLFIFLMIVLTVSVANANQSRVDSLQAEMQKRILRITELQVLAKNDSVVATKSDELETLLNEVETVVSDLNLVFDGSKLSITGNNGSFSISLPDELDESLSNQISSLTAQLLAEIPDSSSIGQGINDIRSGLSHFGLVDQEIQVIAEIVVVEEDIVVHANQIVDGDVVVISGSLTVNGAIQGDLIVVNGSLFLEEDSIVQGDVIAVFSESCISPQSSIDGRVITIGSDIIPESYLKWISKGPIKLVSILSWLVVSNLMIVLLLVLLPEKRIGNIFNYLKNSTLTSTGIGMLWIVIGNIGVITLIAILSMTIIAIPLAVLLVIAYLVSFLVSVGVVARWLGESIASKLNICQASVWQSVMIGCFVIELPVIISVIPGAGSLLGLLSVIVLITTHCIGTGAIIGCKFGSNG
jgi:hypothetical protein